MLLFAYQKSGAAGSRTRVQTSSRIGFYMLRLSLIVGKQPVKDEPTVSLSPEGSQSYRGNNFVKPGFS